MAQMSVEHDVKCGVEEKDDEQCNKPKPIIVDRGSRRNVRAGMFLPTLHTDAGEVWKCARYNQS